MSRRKLPVIDTTLPPPMPPLVVPYGHTDSTFIISLSGGKDSVAVTLAMREAGIPARYVFADTGWEAPQTYDYLGTLEARLGITIDRVHPAGGGMIAKVIQRLGFPARVQRWCTRELKVYPIKEYHNRVADKTNTDTVSVVGIRAEESKSRAAMLPFEFCDSWDGYVWRPIIHWTVRDVLAIHKRHNIPVNPLYSLGFNRVGCMPCIFARKNDIRLLAKHFPERVDRIRQLEKDLGTFRADANRVEPGRFSSLIATFFMAKSETKGVNGERVYPVAAIDKVVEWANTAHGGKAPIDDGPPDGGCYRWGLCDTGVKED